MNADQVAYQRMAEALFDTYNDTFLGRELPKCRVTIASRRNTRTAGRFLYRYGPPSFQKEDWTEMTTQDGRKHYWVKIELSMYYIEKNVAEVMNTTLKHEMAHYWELYTRGVVGHGPWFERACLKLECNPARFHNMNVDERPDGEYVYFCTGCGEISRYSGMVHSSKGTCGSAVCEPCSFMIGGTVQKRFLGKASELSRVPAESLAALGLRPILKVAANERGAI